MGMSIDDMYDWLYRLKSELVVYMPKEWHEPMRCSIQDAITFSRKYQMLKADYENRLKADLKAILVELQVEIEELDPSGDEWSDSLDACNNVIQQKINELKADQEWKE